jgi:hypothetical protein
VEVVGELLDLSSDLRRPYGVDGAADGLEIHFAENIGEGVP